MGKGNSPEVAVLTIGLSYLAVTVLPNTITRNRIVLSFKDSPRKSLRRRPGVDVSCSCHCRRRRRELGVKCRRRARCRIISRERMNAHAHIEAAAADAKIAFPGNVRATPASSSLSASQMSFYQCGARLPLALTTQEHDNVARSTSRDGTTSWTNQPPTVLLGGNSIGFFGRLNHGLNHRLTSPTRSRSSLGYRPSLGGLLGGLKILLNCHPAGL